MDASDSAAGPARPGFEPERKRRELGEANDGKRFLDELTTQAERFLDQAFLLGRLNDDDAVRVILGKLHAELVRKVASGIQTLRNYQRIAPDQTERVAELWKLFKPEFGTLLEIARLRPAHSRIVASESASPPQAAPRPEERKQGAPPLGTDDAAAKSKRKSKGGRRAENPKGDAKIAEAWATGNYATCKALAEKLGGKMTGKDVEAALDRHRHWKKKHGKS